MKWPRYTRIISLEIQVGITSQINRWANTDPGHTGGGIRCLGGVSTPCRPVTPAVSQIPSSWMRSHPLSKSVCQVRSKYWNEKCQTTYGSSKVCNYELDHCNSHRSCETPTSNETVEIPVLSICLSVVYSGLKTARTWSRPLHIVSVERYTCHMQVIVGCCYRLMGSWQ
jgi:hypothetical protein